MSHVFLFLALFFCLWGHLRRCELLHGYGKEKGYRQARMRAKTKRWIGALAVLSVVVAVVVPVAIWLTKRKETNPANTSAPAPPTKAENREEKLSAPSVPRYNLAATEVLPTPVREPLPPMNPPVARFVRLVFGETVESITFMAIYVTGRTRAIQAETTAADLGAPMGVTRVVLLHQQLSPDFATQPISVSLELLDVDGQSVVYREDLGFVQVVTVDLTHAMAFRSVCWRSTDRRWTDKERITEWPSVERWDAVMRSRGWLEYDNTIRGVRVDQMGIGSPVPMSTINRPMFAVVRLPRQDNALVLFASNTDALAGIGYTPDGQLEHGIIINNVQQWSTAVGPVVPMATTAIVIGLQYSLANNGQTLRVTMVHPTGRLFRIDYPKTADVPFDAAAMGFDPLSAATLDFDPDVARNLVVHEICTFPYRGPETGPMSDAQLIGVHAELTQRWLPQSP